jgi:hypothetical protein
MNRCDAHCEVRSCDNFACALVLCYWSSEAIHGYFDTASNVARIGIAGELLLILARFEC